MNHYNRGRRDANEKQILELLRARGVRYIQLREGDGADLLVVILPMEFWEIKNGSLCPSDQKLTGDERKLQDDCDETGINYLVIHSLEEANSRLDLYFKTIGGRNEKGF